MDLKIISLIGIFLGMACLIYLVFRGISILIVAPLASAVIAVLSGENIISILTGPYIEGFVDFAQKNFFIFFFSAIFGKLMGECGAAQSIAYKFSHVVKRLPQKYQKVAAVLSLVLLSLTFTLCGISAFVVVFTLVVIARKLFEEMDVPWRFYTCAPLGSGVIAQSMIPGTPSVHNLIPTQYLGTTPTAAPTIGIICAIVAACIGTVYITHIIRKAERAGEGFLPSGQLIKETDMIADEDPKIPLLKCFLPSILLLITLNILKQDAVTALIVGIIAIYIVFFKTLHGRMIKALTAGAQNSINTVVSVCSTVGFGVVATSVGGYDFLLTALNHIPGPPIVQMIVAINVCAGVSGSSSGGLGIAFSTMTDQFLASGLNPEVIHRVAVIASCGLDSLPHTNGLITDLSVTKLTHRQAYAHYGFLTVVTPLICVTIAAILAELGVV